MTDWREKYAPAKATFVVHRSVVQTFVRSCPFCGESHWHGGSALDHGDPRSAFDPRVVSAHCSRLDHHPGDYRLVWSGEPAVYGPWESPDAKARAGMARLRRLGILTSSATLKLPPRSSKLGKWG